MDSEKIQWPKIVSKILRTEMAKRGISYEELVIKLETIGVLIQVGDLRGRVSRGTFSATLFIQCLRALGVKNLLIEDSYFENFEA